MKQIVCANILRHWKTELQDVKHYRHFEYKNTKTWRLNGQNSSCSIDKYFDFCPICLSFINTTRCSLRQIGLVFSADLCDAGSCKRYNDSHHIDR